MGAQSTVLKWDLLRSLASTSVSATYTAVGVPFTYPARIVRILNASTADVTVSVDGTNDYDYVPAAMSVQYEAGTNRGNSSPEMNFQQGTQILVKGTAGTGTIYVIVLYAYSPPNPVIDS